MGKHSKWSNALATLLKEHYGEIIAIRQGSSSTYSFDLKTVKHGFQYAAYIHEVNHIILFWNLNYRERKGCSSRVLELIRKQADAVKCEDDKIDKIERMFYVEGDKQRKKEPEAVLALTDQALLENVDNLPYMALPPDAHFDEIEKRDFERGRHALTAWNRSCEFRAKVVRSYSGQCAVCRCKEEEILEAAHIIAVADNGTDDVSNGICLCRNHHRMLDKGIIQIDYKNLKLSFAKETVKSMAWYSEFMTKYNGKIMERAK